MSVSTLALGLWWALASAAPGAPSAEGDRAGPVPDEVLAHCQRDLDRVVGEAARFGSAARRAQALLAGLSTACEGVLPVRLRQGAGEAASVGRAERALRLREAARDFVPEDCLPARAARAREVEAHCPPPEDTLFARPLPDSLDLGSYVFALATRARLRELGAYDSRAQRWVAEFLLRSALEGEEGDRAARR